MNRGPVIGAEGGATGGGASAESQPLRRDTVRTIAFTAPCHITGTLYYGKDVFSSAAFIHLGMNYRNLTATCTCSIASYSGALNQKKCAWFPLFAHAHN